MHFRVNRDFRGVPQKSQKSQFYVKTRLFFKNGAKFTHLNRFLLSKNRFWRLFWMADIRELGSGWGPFWMAGHRGKIQKKGHFLNSGSQTGLKIGNPKICPCESGFWVRNSGFWRGVARGHAPSRTRTRGRVYTRLWGHFFDPISHSLDVKFRSFFGVKIYRFLKWKLIDLWAKNWSFFRHFFQ